MTTTKSDPISSDELAWLMRLLRDSAPWNRVHALALRRIEELERELACITEGRAHFKALWQTAESALAAERQKANLFARKDAERYRWLRDNCEDCPDEFGSGAQVYFGTYAAGTLDAAIDAAMSEEKPK